MINKETISNLFKELQADIIHQLEIVDGKSKFIVDEWQHTTGGGGLSRVIQDGAVFEKGGVNFSGVTGPLPEFLQKENGPKGDAFFATGVSIVIHPSSPKVPIIHMNIRYFETNGGTWWFGGGIDLTPIYVVEEDVNFFHNALKDTCDKYQADFYPKYKKWADDYFYIPHRKETRGVGGIFFDHLNDENTSFTKEQLLDFVLDVGKTFAPTYSAIVNKHKHEAFTEREKQWQLLRRGRYVEFNLVYDRGTKFGLETGGRTESILMSLPKEVNWLYNFIPEKGSLEEKTLEFLRRD